MLWEIVYSAAWAFISLCSLGLGFDPHLRSSTRKISLIFAANSLVGASVVGILAEDDKSHVNRKEAILRDK